MTAIVKERSGERGNVLFLILIAVALFAALSYAVTQSTRSGSGDASSETNLINSAQLASYPAGVRTAVVRMVIGGIAVDNLNFDTPANATSALEYNVFHPTGGGAVYQVAPKDLLDPGASGEWVYSSKYQIENIGQTTGTDVGNEVIAFLPLVTRNVCKKLNDEVGITTSGGSSDGIPGTGDLGATPPGVPVDTEGMTYAAPGTAGIGVYLATIGGELAGQPFGCYRVGAVGASAQYVYYHVLVER